MKSFILFLLAVILIKPCLAQVLDNDDYSGTAFHFQNPDNRSFHETIVSLEKAGFLTQLDRKTDWIVKINQPAFWSNIQGGDSNEFAKDKMYIIGPGNGGGGAFYQAEVIDMWESQLQQAMMLEARKHVLSEGSETFYQPRGRGMRESQSQQAMMFEKYKQDLQGTDFNSHNLNVKVWKNLMPVNEYIAKELKAISQTGLAQPKLKIMQTEPRALILSSQYEPAYFESEGVQAVPADDVVFISYREDINAMLQGIREEAEAGFTDDFYTLDIPARNHFIYVVGPGNGGGGTYMLHRK